jgi:hypothetical protein
MKFNYILLGIILIVILCIYGGFKEGLHAGSGIKHGGFDEEKTCSACDQGYSLADDRHSCNLIPIPNCHTRDGVLCKNCEDGYKLTEKRNACIPAEFTNCETQEGLVCKKCKRGFKLSWNKKLCLAVPIPRCEKQTDLTCNRCVKPYKLSNNKCDDCDSGFNYEDGWCKVAKPGQIQNCKHQKEGICIVCRDGYNVANGGKSCSKPLQEKINPKDYDLVETTCKNVVCPKGYSSKPKNTVCKSEKVKKKPKKVEPKKIIEKEIKKKNKKIEEKAEEPALGDQKSIDILMKPVMGLEAAQVKKAQKELDIAPPKDKCPPAFDDASMKKELEKQNSTINSLREQLNKLLKQPAPPPVVIPKPKPLPPPPPPPAPKPAPVVQKPKKLTDGERWECKKSKSGQVWCAAKIPSVIGNEMCGHPAGYAGQYYSLPKNIAQELWPGAVVGDKSDCATNYFWTKAAYGGRLAGRLNTSSMKCWDNKRRWARNDPSRLSIVRCTTKEGFVGGKEGFTVMSGGGNGRMKSAEAFTQKGVGTLL